ncbi:hypothetical protein FHW67_004198, partial [Herbaspirillum sp. Sphag1AN]|nr:hypothetical protein [Herbaspirillum sp. Sphag1AN]MBB3248068.1 hypothetical protein [Herbaspirillum sp. Sphag64]
MSLHLRLLYNSLRLTITVLRIHQVPLAQASSSWASAAGIGRYQPGMTLERVAHAEIQGIHVLTSNIALASLDREAVLRAVLQCTNAH